MCCLSYIFDKMYPFIIIIIQHQIFSTKTSVCEVQSNRGRYYSVFFTAFELCQTLLM